jgi:hypothetical protein
MDKENKRLEELLSLREIECERLKKDKQVFYSAT